MALLDNIFGGPGGWLGPQVGTTPDFQQPFPPVPFPPVSFDWLRQLLSQDGGYASGAPSDVAVAGLQPTTNFNDRFGNLPPAVAAPPPVFNQPTLEQAGRTANPLDYYTNPFGSLQVPTAAPGPAIDLSARQRTPVPAITQSDIQPTPQQAPQPAGPDFGDRLLAGITNFNTGGNPIGGLFNSIRGFSTGQRMDEVGVAQQNQMQAARAAFQYIKSKNPNMPNEQAASLAQMIAVDPKVGQELFKPATTMEAAIVHPLNGGASGGQGIGNAPLQQFGEFNTTKEQSSKLGQKFADDYSKIQADVRSAVSQKGVLDRMAKLSPQAYEGAGAPGLQYANSFIRTFLPGIPINSVKAGEEFTALSNRAALEKLGTFGTGISNADRESIMDQFPRLAQTAQGRMQIIQTMRALTDRQIQVGQLADQWLSTHPTMKGFEVAVAKWADENPIFPGGNRQGGGTTSGGLGWSITK